MRVIDSVTIRYFRSVYTLTLAPCKDITVITGKNDVGKSNILKALNLFFCNQSDSLHSFDFNEDYSILRKENVKKDTIRGQQFISISVKFLRGERMPNSLPPIFHITKRWDMHSSEAKTTSNVQQRMRQYAKKVGIKYSEKTTNTSLSTFLNKLQFVYVPAVKDERVFNGVLNLLQQSLFDAKNKKVLDRPIEEANIAVQEIVNELQTDFQSSTGIKNRIALPSTFNFARGLLQVNTDIENGSVTIDRRGDGIRSHYIPKVLNYVATHSNKIFIWGFEEPENSYEYRRCIQVAHEFDTQYSQTSQIFITSHSPAFFANQSGKKIVFRVCSNKNGKTEKYNDATPLDEELGYIELYRNFADKIAQLQDDNKKKNDEIENLQNYIEQRKKPIILTEGKTDEDFLRLAIEKLGLNAFSQWDIKPVTCGKTANNETLLRLLTLIKDNAIASNLVIGMFDRDSELIVKQGNNAMDIREEEYYKFSDCVYAFAIPVPHNRPEKNQISIEHYFTDKEIMTELDGKRLFLGNEFYETGVYKGDERLHYKGARNVFNTIKIVEHETRQYVTKEDGSGDYSISKTAFVRGLKENCDGFGDISFEEFRKIFNILDKIYQNYLSITVPDKR